MSPSMLCSNAKPVLSPGWMNYATVGRTASSPAYVGGDVAYRLMTMD